jgi:hypothetical protein
MKALLLLAIALAAPAAAAQARRSRHKITIKFDYDFTRTPPCSAKVKKKCVQRFTVYDISAGWAKRTALMSVPVPPGAHGIVNGISATTPLLLFEPGKHWIAVVAQMPEGAESDPYRCTVWVEIP